MKIFDNVDGFEGRVNFVDECNVVVGYETDQQCFERSGWYINDDAEPLMRVKSGVVAPPSYVPPVDGYAFDEFYVRTYVQHDDDDYAGGEVVFRLVHPTEPAMFLHLFNLHNGFYSHGFHFKSDKVNMKGAI